MADDSKAPNPKLTAAFELLRKIRTIRASNEEQADVYMQAFNAAAGRIRQAGPCQETIKELGDTVQCTYLIPSIRIAAAKLMADQAKGNESQTITWLESARQNDYHNEPFREGINGVIAALHKIELDEIRSMTAAVKLPDGPKLNLNL
jgi:hypothetical protein